MSLADLISTYGGGAVGAALVACGYPDGPPPEDDPVALAECVAELEAYLSAPPAPVAPPADPIVVDPVPAVDPPADPPVDPDLDGGV